MSELERMGSEASAWVARGRTLDAPNERDRARVRARLTDVLGASTLAAVKPSDELATSAESGVRDVGTSPRRHDEPATAAASGGPVTGLGARIVLLVAVLVLGGALLHGANRAAPAEKRASVTRPVASATASVEEAPPQPARARQRPAELDASARVPRIKKRLHPRAEPAPAARTAGSRAREVQAGPLSSGGEPIQASGAPPRADAAATRLKADAIARDLVLIAEPRATVLEPRGGSTIVAPSGRASERARGGHVMSGELELMASAQDALRDGRLARALTLLALHAARYPHGMLEQERRAARAVALCRTGERNAARSELRALARDTPHSPLLRWARSVCEP